MLMNILSKGKPTILPVTCTSIYTSFLSQLRWALWMKRLIYYNHFNSEYFRTIYNTIETIEQRKQFRIANPLLLIEIYTAKSAAAASDN